MDKRSPEDIRKSIKSLVEEAESVSIDNDEIALSSNDLACCSVQFAFSDSQSLSNLLKADIQALKDE